MKILMVHSGVLDVNTGGGTHTYELLKNLQNMGHVTCFVARQKKKLNLPNIVEVFFIDAPCLRMLSYYFALILYISYYLMKQKPDIIYVRKTTFGLSPLIISKIFSIPYVVEVNALVDADLRMLKENTITFFINLYVIMDNFHFKHSTKIITVTQGIKNEIIKKYNVPEEKIIFIENGVNPEKFYPIDQETALLKLQFNSSKKFVCFVGGLAPWHGVEYLIQAAPSILKEFPEVHFLIIGNGPMKKTIVQQIKKSDLSKNFTLTGNVEQSIVHYYINVSELCVAPFTATRNMRMGLSPLKIYEYLACGKPVVASNVPGVSDILLKSGGGILVNPDDPVELGSAIIALLKDSKERKRMGEAGFRFVSSNHTWLNTAKKTYDVFKSLL